MKCSNNNQLIRENEQLKRDVEKLKQSQEERLSQQASMFHSLMHHKETLFKNKLKMVQIKNKTLNKSIKRKENKITNLKTLFKHLKDKNILENDATFRLSNEFGNLLVPLLQNEKKNKDKSVHGRRYSEEVKRFATTMHYYSPAAYGYCRSALTNFCFLFYQHNSVHINILIHKRINNFTNV